MAVRSCTKCSLKKYRTQIVFPDGDPNAKILFIGEAPGLDEDAEGIPFVGRSGRLLRSIVSEVGLDEFGVVYDNVVKCRSNENKAPDAVQVAACYRHLDHTIRKVNPQVIVPLGASALKRILRSPDITQHQGSIYWHMVYNAWVIPQFHPAFILRQLTRREEYVRGFKTIREVLLDLPKEWANRVDRGSLDYSMVRSVDELETLWEVEVRNAQYLTFDTEARMWGKEVHPFKCDILGLSLCWSPGRAVYIPFFDTDTQEEIRWSNSALDLMRSILTSDIPKGAHNSNFDRIVLWRSLGVHTENVVDDTMVAGHCYDSGMSKKLQAWSCVVGMAGYDWGIDPWTLGKKKEDIDYSRIPLSVLAEYCCGDSDCCFRLAHFLEEHTPAGQRRVYYSIGMGMVDVTRGMELRGIRVDRKAANDLRKHYERQLKYVEKSLDCILRKHAIDPKEFNWNSDRDVKRLLFEIMGLPVLKRSRKTGVPSFDVHVKKALKEDYPAVRLLWERKRLIQALTMFVIPLSGPVLDEHDRVHTIYWVPGTGTGRLSSSKPNLQQITGPTDEHPIPRIRNLFIAPPTGMFAALDISQAEIAVTAMYSKDPNLRRAMVEGADVHASMAARIYGKSESEVSKHERSQTKKITFGLIYGETVHGLSRELGIDPDEAEALMKAYFDQFPTVRNWIRKEMNKAYRFGYVQNVFGRKRYLRNLRSPNEDERMKDERRAVNTLIQGTTSDIVSLGTIDLYKTLRIRRSELKAWLVMSIHDAVVVECLLRSRLSAVKQVLEGCMLGVGKKYRLDVVLRGEVKTGWRWGDLDVGILDETLTGLADFGEER
jgi:DNA polymerase-1